MIHSVKGKTLDDYIEEQKEFHGPVVSRLINQAAAAQEIFTQDELERYAEEYRRERGIK